MTSGPTWGRFRLLTAIWDKLLRITPATHAYMIRRISKEEKEKLRQKRAAAFFGLAKELHGNRYDYSRAIYKTQKDKIWIGCPDHGWFEQTPNRHLQGAGCRKCGEKIRGSNKSKRTAIAFAEKFRRVNGHVLEMLSEYRGSHEKIRLRCFERGHEFERSATNIDQTITGICPVCSQESLWASMRLSQRDFVSRVNQKHPNLDTSKLKYVDWNTPVTIICEHHGKVSALPGTIMASSYGCPRCGDEQIGYAGYRLANLESGDPKYIPRPTRIALMVVNVWGYQCLKVGITTRSIESRYREFLKTVLYEALLDELDALKLEKLIHVKYKSYKDLRVFYKGMRDGSRWSGDSELYRMEAKESLYEDLCKYVEEIAHADDDYWDRHNIDELPILRARKSKFDSGEWNERKPVICLDTKNIYSSATAAAKAVGSTVGNVSSVCLGKRRTTKGHRFAYLDDYKQGNVIELPPPRTGENAYNAKAVRCIETGAIYPTSMEAQRATGINASKITTVCKGKRKTTGGYHWEYAKK